MLGITRKNKQPDEQRDQRSMGFAAHLCLALIRERPHYGFEVLNKLRALGVGEASEQTIYLRLGRLEVDGLLEGYLVPNQAGPARKYYRITQEGEELLERWNREWREFKSSMDSVIGTGS